MCLRGATAEGDEMGRVFELVSAMTMLRDSA